MDGQKGLFTNTNKQRNLSVSETMIDKKDYEEADKRICRVSKLPYSELTRFFSKLWYGFKINPYANERLLQQLEKITSIPKSDIKIWIEAKRRILNISWSQEEITENVHKPSTCDCLACNIVYEGSLENEGCFSFELEMRDQFI